MNKLDYNAIFENFWLYNAKRAVTKNIIINYQKPIGTIIITFLNIMLQNFLAFWKKVIGFQKSHPCSKYLKSISLMR